MKANYGIRTRFASCQVFSIFDSKKVEYTVTFHDWNEPRYDLTGKFIGVRKDGFGIKQSFNLN